MWQYIETQWITLGNIWNQVTTCPKWPAFLFMPRLVLQAIYSSLSSTDFNVNYHRYPIQITLATMLNMYVLFINWFQHLVTQMSHRQTKWQTSSHVFSTLSTPDVPYTYKMAEWWAVWFEKYYYRCSIKCIIATMAIKACHYNNHWLHPEETTIEFQHYCWLTAKLKGGTR